MVIKDGYSTTLLWCVWCDYRVKSACLQKINTTYDYTKPSKYSDPQKTHEMVLNRHTRLFQAFKWHIPGYINNLHISTQTATGSHLCPPSFRSQDIFSPSQRDSHNLPPSFSARTPTDKKWTWGVIPPFPQTVKSNKKFKRVTCKDMKGWGQGSRSAHKVSRGCRDEWVWTHVDRLDCHVVSMRHLSVFQSPAFTHLEALHLVNTSLELRPTSTYTQKDSTTVKTTGTEQKVNIKANKPFRLNCIMNLCQKLTVGKQGRSWLSHTLSHW